MKVVEPMKQYINDDSSQQRFLLSSSPVSPATIITTTATKKIMVEEQRKEQHKVRFCNDIKVKKISTYGNRQEQQEQSVYWYTRSDFKSMKELYCQLVVKMERTIDMETLRANGLETKKCAKRKRDKYRMGQLIVFMEQEKQWQNGKFRPDKIAKLSCQYSQDSIKEAHTRGTILAAQVHQNQPNDPSIKDRTFAKDDHEETNRSQTSSSLSIQKQSNDKLHACNNPKLLSLDYRLLPVGTTGSSRNSSSCLIQTSLPLELPRL